MNNPYTRFAPVLILAALVAVFLTADKLWLHWYASDTGGTKVERNIQTPPCRKKVAGTFYNKRILARFLIPLPCYALI